MKVYEGGIKMRLVLLTAILIFCIAIQNSYAQESISCSNCSLINQNEFEESVNIQGETTILQDKSEKSSIVTIKDSFKKNADPEEYLFQSKIERLDELFKLYKFDENFIEDTKSNIDILANFRQGENGQDVLVPLGFFLYLNKKF